MIIGNQSLAEMVHSVRPLRLQYLYNLSCLLQSMSRQKYFHSRDRPAIRMVYRVKMLCRRLVPHGHHLPLSKSASSHLPSPQMIPSRLLFRLSKFSLWRPHLKVLFRQYQHLLLRLRCILRVRLPSSVNAA